MDVVEVYGDGEEEFVGEGKTLESPLEFEK